MTVDRRALLGSFAASIVPLSGIRAFGAPRSVVTLRAEPGSLKLRDGVDTAIWAYNGQVPGPVLRIAQGGEIEVQLSNGLPQPTSLCWHGVRVANAMDGVAGLTQPAVKPGETFTYKFTPPDSGTYWYHPHAWPHSAEQIGRGLHGVLIVDEPDPPPVDEDLLVVLNDWMLDPQGQIRIGDAGEIDAKGAGLAAPLLTVNAKPIPEVRALRPGARLRVRILNACSARIAVVSVVGLRASVLAIDGQPSEMFEPAGGTVPIGPGSRFDLLLDAPPAPAATAAIVLRGNGVPDQPIVAFRPTGAALSSHGTPVRLAVNPHLPTRIPLESSLKRDLVIAAIRPSTASGKGPPTVSSSVGGEPGARMAWTLGGKASDGVSGPPLFTVRRGGAVTLAFVNQTDAPQQMHVHGHAFRILHDLDDGWDPYWRDSVLIAPKKTKHVAFVADNPGRWAVESLMLDRQITGLAGYFAVTADGR